MQPRLKNGPSNFVRCIVSKHDITITCIANSSDFLMLTEYFDSVDFEPLKIFCDGKIEFVFGQVMYYIDDLDNATEYAVEVCKALDALNERSFLLYDLTDGKPRDLDKILDILNSN